MLYVINIKQVIELLKTEYKIEFVDYNEDEDFISDTETTD